MAGVAVKTNTAALIHLQQEAWNSGHAKRDVKDMRKGSGLTAQRG